MPIDGVVWLCLICHDRNPHHSGSQESFFMSIFGSDTPFMLLPKLKVKEGKVAEYLEIADETDKAV